MKYNLLIMFFKIYSSFAVSETTAFLSNPISTGAVGVVLPPLLTNAFLIFSVTANAMTLIFL